MTLEEVCSQLALIGRHCEFVSLTDVENNHLPSDCLSCLVTFDDGLQEQFYAHELLKGRGIPSAIFVPTMYLETGKAIGVHKLHAVIEALDLSLIKKRIALFIQERNIRPKFYDDACIKGPALYKNDPADIASIKFFVNFSLTAPQRDALVSALFDYAFVESVWVTDNYITPAQIQDTAATGSVSAHGHTHEPLALLSRTAARNDMLRSKKLLEQLTNRQINTISYPYGRGDALADWVYIEAEACGFVCGLTTHRGINRGMLPTLNMRRYDCNELPGGSRPLFDADRLQDQLCALEEPLAGL
ncbi:polysaccharide deacetylase family protein [Nitrospiraceae bacterium AH_259_D15_M11_P09]|nr:polysaccharide deacetylase family protein [Nitrospiraceae bacterium AH_259_D15_M11_P09]